MATNEDLKEFIEQMLTNYDPSIDLSPDSEAQTQIISPIIAYVGDDPLDTPIEEFIRSRIADQYPQVESETGSPLSQLILGPARVLLGPVTRSINLLKERQRADTLSVHTEESIQAKLSNLFLEMGDGEYAQGSVRIYYDSPRYVEATSDKVFSTAGGLNYFPNGNQSITAAQMLYNKEGAYYYFDIQIIAQSPGVDYNVSAGDIVVAQGFPGYSRVTNRYSITQGVDAETVEEFWYRASVYPTETSLNTNRGLTANVRDRFPSIADMQTVGHGDEEMIRDIIKGGGYGDAEGYAEATTSTITLVEDGDYDFYSDIIYTDGIDFTTIVGPVAEYETPRAGLDIFWVDNTGTYMFDTFDIVEIIDANTVRIDEEIRIDTAALVPMVFVSVRLRSISISEIPGGFSDPAITPPVSQPDSIHVGGAVDVYIKDPEPTTAEVDLTLVSDETYVSQHEYVTIASGNTYAEVYDVTGDTFWADTFGSAQPQVGTDWVRLTDLGGGLNNMPTRLVEGAVIQLTSGANAGYYRIGAVSTANFFTGPYVSVQVVEIDGSAFLAPWGVGGGVNYNLIDYTSQYEKGYVLHLTSGEPGVYRILRYNAGSLPAYSTPLVRMYLDYTFTSTSINNTGQIYDDIEIDLSEPKNVRIEDNDLAGTLGTRVFVSTGGTNFTSAGVVPGDVLRVITGPAAGDYTVESVFGGGSSNIRVEEMVEATCHNVSFMIFDLLDAPELPLLKVNDIEVTDANLSPTGVEVPCGDPLAFRTGEFTNFSDGIVAETTRATLGIFSNMPAATYSVNGEELRLVITYPNGITLDDTVTFASASLPPPDLTIGEVCAAINTYFSDEYAVPITVGTQTHIGIRPIGNTNIFVQAPAGVDASIKLGLRYENGPPVRYMATNGIYFPDPVTSGFSRERDFFYCKLGVNAPRLVAYSFTLSGTAVGDVFYMEDQDNFWPEGFATVAFGAPSLGRVRAYFKDPTYFFVDKNFRITVDDAGVDKDYMLYPVDMARIIPAPDSTADNPTLDEPVGGTDNFIDSDAAFWSDLIRDGLDSGYPFMFSGGGGSTLYPGDVLHVTYRKCWFDTVLPAPINWAGEWIRFSVGDSQVETIYFSNGMTDQGVVDAINAVFPGVASLVAAVPGPGNWLVLESDELIDSFEMSAGAAFVAWGATFYPTTNDNRATNHGWYYVERVVDQNTLQIVGGAIVVAEQRVGPTAGEVPADVRYEIFRGSSYHIGPTEMVENTEAGLYYADFDMMSYGVGNEFNIDADMYGEGSDYTCKGYRLGTDNPALSFSPDEELRLYVTSTFLENGLEARPSKSTVVASNNINLEYEYSELVQSVNDYVSADTERVMVASTMAKHMLPHYVGSTITYRGGPTASAAKDEVERIIEQVYSGQTLEVSDIVNVLYSKGANYVNLPVQLFIIYQDVNRKLFFEIVENTDTLSRLAAYFADLDRLSFNRS